MKSPMVVLFFVSTILGLPGSLATTWAEKTVKDPISGDACKVQGIASYGSYIYRWPSKYDQVFWPHTSGNWIWHCRSGYASFGDDFEKLSVQEIERIKAYLQESPINKAILDEHSDLLFQHLEALYKLREKDEKFWDWFLRVKAHYFEARAQASRRAALDRIIKLIPETEPSFRLIEYYYLAGDYHRRFGDLETAAMYFDKARAVKWKDDDGNDHTGSNYINEIIAEREILIRAEMEIQKLGDEDE